MGAYKITVEVPLALCYFSFQLVGNLIVNLNMYKVCYNILKYPEAVCVRLGRYTDNATRELENEVQPYAGTITTISEMVPVTIPIVLSLMIGSWSDKHGRKPVLVIILLCMTLGFSIGAIILSFKEINPWWIMSSTIPSVLCGGIMTFFIIVLSYLNDTATPENRAWRMVSIDAIQIGTTLAGGISSSFILYATSYSSIYGTCALLVATGCAYAYFFCPESLKRKSEEKPTIKSLFQWNNITDLFKVAWRKREYGKRTLIFLLMSSQIIVHFVVYGEVTVKTLYLRNRFNWTMQEKNIFSAYSSVLIVICTIACTYLLHKKFKIREGVLVIMSLTSTIASTLLFALSNTNNFLYISAVAGMFSGLAIPMTRTMMAKLIVPEEMGKLYSLVMVINTIGMLVSSVMYQQIYNTTMKNHPEIFNYISFGLYVSVVVIVIFVMIFESRIPAEDIDEKNKNVINSE